MILFHLSNKMKWKADLKLKLGTFCSLDVINRLPGVHPFLFSISNILVQSISYHDLVCHLAALGHISELKSSLSILYLFLLTLLRSTPIQLSHFILHIEIFLRLFTLHGIKRHAWPLVWSHQFGTSQGAGTTTTTLMGWVCWQHWS